MLENVLGNLFRVVATVLLAVIAYYQAQIHNELTELSSRAPTPVATQDVRVVKWETDPLEITTPHRFVAGTMIESAIPVIVKNNRLVEPIPVQVER